MNVKIVYDSDTGRHYPVHPNTPYTGHLPVIDIPDHVLDGYFEARDCGRYRIARETWVR